jgi:hypothetical protein
MHFLTKHWVYSDVLFEPVNDLLHDGPQTFGLAIFLCPNGPVPNANSGLDRDSPLWCDGLPESKEPIADENIVKLARGAGEDALNALT